MLFGADDINAVSRDSAVAVGVAAVRLYAAGVTLVVLLTHLSSCVSSPPPRLIHRDALTEIQLMPDPHQGTRHSHPASISSQTIARLLEGLRVQSRSTLFGAVSGVEGQAFSPVEVQALASRLSQALQQAQPGEIATFYRRVSDANLGLGITSGAIFVDGTQVFLVLANHRSRPTEVMREGITYGVDPVDNPLFSLARAAFTVSFYPSEAVVKFENRRPWTFAEDSRVVAIDLARLDGKSKATSSPAQ